MSWRNGSNLFLEIWPQVKKNIPDEDLRGEFASKLIELFAYYDMDPMDLADSDPELDRLLGHESSDVDEEESVRICIRGLHAKDPGSRTTSAEAICHFVGAAGGGLAQEAATALAEALDFEQTDEFILAALKSLRDLVWDDDAIIAPNLVRPFLESANPDVSERAQYVMKGLSR